MRERTVSAAWVGQVLEAMADEGLDTSEFCRRAGLDRGRLVRPDGRFSLDQLSELWRHAVVHAQDQTLAIRMGSAIRLAGYGVVGYSMMASPNLHAALFRMCRYTKIISDITEMSLCTLDVGVRLDFKLHIQTDTAHRQRHEFTFISVLTLCRWITARDLCPLRIEFQFPKPADLQPYQDIFRCPLHFGSVENGILFSHADLALRLPTANPGLTALHDHLAEKGIRALSESRTIAAVRRELVARLPDGEPGRELIAQALGMSQTTLHRKLQKDGTSFHLLLDTIRRELAEHHLASDMVSLLEITYLLGFSDQSTFNRAAKRWFGASPGQTRQRLKTQQ